MHRTLALLLASAVLSTALGCGNGLDPLKPPMIACWGDAPSDMNRQHVSNQRCTSVPFVIGRDLDVRATVAK